jgi:hypothetical protein
MSSPGRLYNILAEASGGSVLARVAKPQGVLVVVAAYYLLFGVMGARSRPVIAGQP